MPEPRAAGRTLVIVESPTKANTIKRFLPDGYVVTSSMGHIRDLPQTAKDIPASVRDRPWARLAIDVEKDFEPVYVVTKPRVVADLKRELKGVDALVLATDEDREGEAIAHHLLEVLEPTVPVKRMVFHEITESAIREALDDTREVRSDLVKAQETRRVLDRLVGYTVSPLLWRKIDKGLSAGRVQSVAVRLLVQREKERLAFVPAQYWDLTATARRGSEDPFEATATHVAGIRLASGKDFDDDTGHLKANLTPGENVQVLGQEEAAALAADASGATFTVAKVEAREQSRNPSPPFTTSTLQQEASRKLSWSARDTMRVAQGLYERGLITYMRTDSTHLSGEAIGAARARVEALYGEAYLFERVRQYRGKARNAQEAHEAIRPAGGAMKTAKEHRLTGRDAALYELIWKRTIATQMAEAKLRYVTATLEGRAEGRTLTLRASGRQVLFPGFFRAYVEGSDDPDAALDDQDAPLPTLSEGDDVVLEAVEPVGHETKPPARLTEASLVKLLESEGIGRPSTYASIIETIQNRNYVRKQGQQLVPTFTAFATNNLLEHQFRRLVDTEFTAEMEARLDAIAAGEVDAAPYLREFYGGEDGIEARVNEGLESIDAREISTIHATKWAPYVVRVGRYGPSAVWTQEDGTVVRTSIPAEWAPADVTREDLEALLTMEAKGDEPLAHDEAGTPIFLKNGPYGPYVQLGVPDGDAKPKRVSLPPNVAPTDVDAAYATRLLELPRPLGAHPDDGKKVVAGIGRYGPYVKHGSTYASLGKGDDVLEVELERAQELLAKKQRRGRPEPLKTLGTHPDDAAPVELHEGRYGPYVKHGKTNASLRKGHDPETITLDEALELLAAREARAGTKKGRSAAKGATKKAATSKRAPTKGAKKKAAAKPKRPKATNDDLEPFLERLDATDREVVVRRHGMAGHEAADVAAVAAALSLVETDVAEREKRALFKLRTAFGKARAKAAP